MSKICDCSRQKVGIYDPRSGEETHISEAAFESLLDRGYIDKEGRFATDETIAELGSSPWDLVREATRER